MTNVSLTLTFGIGSELDALFLNRINTNIARRRKGLRAIARKAVSASSEGSDEVVLLFNIFGSRNRNSEPLHLGFTSPNLHPPTSRDVLSKLAMA